MDKSKDFYLGRLKMPDRMRPYLVPLALIFALLLVIYANSFQGTWIFDDQPNILENEHVHVERLDFQNLKDSIYNLNGGINRPLAFLSFGLNYYFGKTNPFGYHLVNFAVHFLTACFLFLLIVKTLHLPLLREAYSRHAYSIALIATVFWAVNPLQVTAVTYIVQRMASMAGLFYVTGMYFYVLGRTSEDRRKQVAWYVAVVFCALLGLATKQNAAMLPVSIFLYDLFLIQGIGRATIRKNLAAAAVPVGVLLVVGAIYTDFSSMLAGYETRPFTMGQRLLTEPRVILFYVSQLLYPIDSRLTLIHEVHAATGLFSPVITFFSIAAIIGVAGFALYRGAKYPLLCFCILFFLVNHAIEGTFVPLELIYEHRNYIPSFFFFVPIAVLIARMLEYFSYRRVLQAAVALLLVIVWVGQGHTVYMRNQRFADPVALWSDNAKKAPGLSRVHTNLGNAFFNNGAYARAYTCYLQAKKTDYHHNIHNKGMLHYNLGRYYFHVAEDMEKASYHEKIARDLYPGNWQAWYYSVLSELGCGRIEKAFDLAVSANEKWPEKAFLRYAKGLVLLKQKDYAGSIESFRAALKRGLSMERFCKLTGVARLYAGEINHAVRRLKTAHESMMADAEVMLALMEAYQKIGNFEGRNQIVQKLICRKKDLSWKDYVKDASEKNVLNAYEIRPSTLFPVIREAMSVMISENE